MRWGILSTARIGAKTIPAIQSAEGCEVVAIASRDLSRAEAAASEHGIARAHGSYADLLADGAVDAVYIPTPNHLHVPLTLEAIAAGKHVLCEKPLALERADALRIAEAAEAAGVTVGEAFMTRHHPQWLRAREIVAEGRIGRLTAIQALFSYHNDDPNNVRNRADIGGGGLYDIGCYVFNAAQFFFGADPEAVAGAVDRDPGFGTDRLTSALARYGDGRHLTFTVATQSARTQSLTLLGTSGALALDIPFNCPADHPARLRILGGPSLSQDAAVSELFEPVDQYALQARDFAGAVASGRRPSTDARAAAATAGAMEALLASAAGGGWVDCGGD